MDVLLSSITTNDTLNEYQRNFSRRAQRVCRENERSNLLAITQLVLNAFLNDQIRGTKARILDEIETREICDFFIMLEKCLCHGLKLNSSQSSLSYSLIGKKKLVESEIWHLLGVVSKSNPTMAELYDSICAMTNLSTSTSKFRAFLRLAMMQKMLAKYFECLYESELTSDFYEPWALIRAESFTFLCGSLLSLNVFDCNLLIDHDQLQEQINSFDISPYFRLPTFAQKQIKIEEENCEENSNNDFEENLEMKKILDQKNYLEERNAQLSSNINQLKSKLETLENAQLNQQQQEETNSSTTQNDDNRSLIFTERLKDMENEREILKARLAEKEDNLRSSQEQLEGTMRFTKDLYEKLRAADGRIKQSQQDLDALKGMYENEIGQLQNTLKCLQKEQQNERVENEEENDEEEESSTAILLREELKSKTQQYSKAMAALRQKHEELSGEKQTVEALRRNCAELEARIEALNCVEKELATAKEEAKRVKRELADARQALQEFSQALSESKLRMVELKDEIGLPSNGAKWMEDNEVNECKLCAIQFSIVQRRHHCRNCGQIFCNACASSRVKLPSNPSPVRVCMNCFHLLRNRQSSTTHCNPPSSSSTIDN